MGEGEMIVTTFRSDNIYRSMSALTSLMRLLSATRSEWTFAVFFAAVSGAGPFISHTDALLDALQDSNLEKQYFRALVGLARASTLLYGGNEAPDGLSHDIRSRLIRLLRANRYLLPSFSAQESRCNMTQV